jgi:hypothetical protein
MVVVTGRAARHAQHGEESSVEALGEEVCHDRMALPAGVSDPGHARRGSPMVPVAVIAGRRGKVVFLAELHPVDTPLIFLHLVGRDTVRRYKSRIGMTCSASLGNLERMDARLWIRWWANHVSRVTVHAGRDVGIIDPRQPLAMNRGGVLSFLVNA